MMQLAVRLSGRRRWPAGLWLLAFLISVAGQRPLPPLTHVALGQPTYTIQLNLLAAGLYGMTDIAQAGDDRLFISNSDGVIFTFANGAVQPEPFLDISARVGSGEGERSLASLAFHPFYPFNGYFYVSYSDLNGDTVIARFRRQTGNPHVADPASELIILTVAQPSALHNGGDIAFGPDGYLYIALGDGGPASDPGHQGQNPATLLGAILRIDVNQPTGYAIPIDNPFRGSVGYRPEIWAYGVRNPWRLSFDRANGALVFGDVGESRREEVNYEPPGFAGGRNYGWSCYEGTRLFNVGQCGNGPLTFPLIEYNHFFGCAVAAGYVYRGQQFPAMVGHLFLADICEGPVISYGQGETGIWTMRGVGDFMEDVILNTFGEDAAGELYVGGTSGQLFQVTMGPPAQQSFLPLAVGDPIPEP